MADLPSNYGFGLVTGGFALAVGDRDDPGREPDAIAAEGSVLFRPQAARIVIPGERVVTPKQITCSLDAEGYLYRPESVTPAPDTGLVAEADRGVCLVANDTVGATPQGWTYEVTVSLTGQSQWRFPIAVTTGSVQDISNLVPVDSSGGTPIIRGPGIHTVEGRNYQMVACVIRNLGDGFELIDDATHKPVGVSHVTENPNGDIVIHYNFTAKANASLVVNTDEAFAARGYTVGASVTPTEARIRVGRTIPMGDYISYHATNGWSSSNGFGTIEASPVPAHQAKGYFVYSFNQPMGTPETSTPVAAPVINSRTHELTAYTTSTVYHHRDPYPGEHGEMLIYFVDNATGEAIPNDQPNTNMQAYVLLNESTTIKVMPEDMVATNGNFWIFGMFEIES